MITISLNTEQLQSLDLSAIAFLNDEYRLLDLITQISGINY